MARHLARHDTQYEPDNRWSPFDCNMAAAGDLIRYWSLGLRDYTHSYLRGLSGDLQGGTTIATAQYVLSRVGVPSTVYDYADGASFEDMLTMLRTRRQVIIAHGDYGSIPTAMRGPIDRTFEGYHSVFLHELVSRPGLTPVIRVGDGLSDAWSTWSAGALAAYMRDFPPKTGGLTFLVATPRSLAAKRGLTAKVRGKPERDAKVLTTIGPRSRVHCGGTVVGDKVGDNAVWFKVWVVGRLGYVHSSMARWV